MNSSEILNSVINRVGLPEFLSADIRAVRLPGRFRYPVVGECSGPGAGRRVRETDPPAESVAEEALPAALLDLRDELFRILCATSFYCDAVRCLVEESEGERLTREGLALAGHALRERQRNLLAELDRLRGKLAD